MKQSAEPHCVACGRAWARHTGIQGTCMEKQVAIDRLAAYKILFGILGQIVLPDKDEPTPEQVIAAVEKLSLRRVV